MDTRQNAINGALHLAGILAPLLQDQLRAAGAAVHELSVRRVDPEIAPLSEGERTTVSLRFEGAMAGQCTLAVDRAGLLPFAAGDAGKEQLLEQALSGACEPFAAALFASYGRVRVSVADSMELAEDELALAELVVAGEGSGAAGDATLVLTFHADGELQRSLTRLARVAAAAEASGITGGNLGLVMDVELNVALRFGQRQLSLREVMELASGSVVELDHEVDEPVELILDGRVIARGEAVIVDGNYGVRVTEVLQPMAF